MTNKLIQGWKEKNYTVSQANEEMLQAGFREEDIEGMLKAYKKEQAESRQKIGFICMAAGAVLGFVSCVMTMLNLLPALTGLFLYGFTTMAIIVILIGCYLVFE